MNYRLIPFLVICFISTSAAQSFRTTFDSLRIDLANISEPRDSLVRLNDLAALAQRFDIELTKSLLFQALNVQGIAKDEHETTRTYWALSTAYNESQQFDSSNYFLDQGLLTGAVQKYPEIEINLKISKAENFSDQGNYEMSLAVLDECEKDIVTLNAPEQLMPVRQIQGQVYQAQSKYDQALLKLKEAIELALQEENEHKLSILFMDVSKLYALQKNYPKQIEFAKKSLAIKEKLGNEMGVLYTINTLVEAYRDQKDDDNYEKLVRKGLGLSRQVKNPIFRATMSFNLSEFHWYSENFDSSTLYLNRAQQIVEEHQLTGSFIKDIYGGKGDLLVARGRLNEAIPMFEKTIEYAKNNNLYESEILYTEKLAQVYEQIQNPVQALALYKKVFHFKDSISRSNSLVEMGALEAKLTNKENEYTIELLEKENAIAEAKTRQTTTAALGVGALALLGFGFFWNARRKNKQIAAQNHEITEKNSLLEQLNQTKDRLFAIIGHDLRKPVVAFNGISETINYLIKKEDYSTLQQLGSEIERDGFALQKLTDNLLNWAIMQRDVIPYNPTSVDLHQCTEEVVSIFRKVSEDKGVKLINRVPKSLEGYADKTGLSTILVNLIDNGIKFTSDGDSVVIDARETPDGVKLEVSDTGTGMKPETIKNAFILQKDKSTTGTSGERGTGLGLHLIHELVQVNHGSIEVESQEGIGSTFRITLPTQEVA